MTVHQKITHCEARQIGQRIADINKMIDTISRHGFADEDFPTGIRAEIRERNADQELIDELDFRHTQLCFVRASSMEGALHQTMSLLGRVNPGVYATEWKREEEERHIDRLIFNLIGFFEDQLGKTRQELGIGAGIPGQSWTETAEELFRMATTAPRKANSPKKKQVAA